MSNTGTWMQRVAQDWLVLELTGGSGTALGITTGLQFLPMPAARAVRRAGRRPVLQAAHAAAHPGWRWPSAPLCSGCSRSPASRQVWHVYVLALRSSASARRSTTRRGSLRHRDGRPPSTCPTPSASTPPSFNIARIVGPAVAGLLIAALGRRPGHRLGDPGQRRVSYVAVIVALRAMRAGAADPAEPRSRRTPGMLREGVRYVRGRPDLLLILLVVFFVGTFGMNFQMTTALMATQVFHKGAGEYGMLGSIMAVGSLTGALLAARRETAALRLVVVLRRSAFGVVEIVAGLMPTYWPFAVCCPVARARRADACSTAANATVQLGVDPGDAGPGDGAVHDDLHGRHARRLADDRLGRRDVRARWTLIGGGLLAILAVCSRSRSSRVRRGPRTESTQAAAEPGAGGPAPAPA